MRSAAGAGSWFPTWAPFARPGRRSGGAPSVIPKNRASCPHIGMKRFPIGKKRVTNFGPRPYRGRIPLTASHRKGLLNGKYEIDRRGRHLRARRLRRPGRGVRSKKVNCKINPPNLPRLYAPSWMPTRGQQSSPAASAEAQEAAFGEAVLTVWAERIKSFATPSSRCSARLAGRRVPLRASPRTQQHLQVRGRRLRG